jgi:hypothetical protein
MSAPILKLSNLRLGVGGQATSEDVSLESVVGEMPGLAGCGSRSAPALMRLPARQRRRWSAPAVGDATNA